MLTLLPFFIHNIDDLLFNSETFSATGNLSSILSHDFLSPMVRILSFLNLIWHKDFTFYNTPNCEFSRSSSFKSREWDMEDLQFSMGMQYGHPSCLHRRQNVVLTNPQMYLSLFFSFCESFSLLFGFCSCNKNAALWLAERTLPACLWTACVPWACPRRRSFSFFFACLSLH